MGVELGAGFLTVLSSLSPFLSASVKRGWVLARKTMGVEMGASFLTVLSSLSFPLASVWMGWL